jgi:hypothetical protein
MAPTARLARSPRDAGADQEQTARCGRLEPKARFAGGAGFADSEALAAHAATARRRAGATRGRAAAQATSSAGEAPGTCTGGGEEHEQIADYAAPIERCT